MEKVFEKDVRFRNLEKKVGVFIILAVIGLLSILLFIGIEKDLFSQKYTIFFRVDSGAGFTEGMPVKLSGFKIGRVRNLSLDEQAQVVVAIEINRKYQKWIRKGSVARLSREGMIGESMIDITVGPQENPAIVEKEDIPFEKVGGMEDLAKEVKPVLQEIKEMLSYINNPEGDIKRSLGNISALTAEIRGTRAQMDKTIVELRGIVSDARETVAVVKTAGEKALPIVDNAGKIVGDLEKRASPILGKMDSLISNLEKTSGQLPEITRKVDGILDDAKKITGTVSAEGPKIKDMIGNSEALLRDTKETLEGVKGSWPVNRMVPKKEEFRLVPLNGAGRGK